MIQIFTRKFISISNLFTIKSYIESCIRILIKKTQEPLNF